MNQIVTLAHGSGGRMTFELVEKVFRRHFQSSLLEQGDDAAVFRMPEGRTAFTTDSFVITPIFFPGGNIGKLAVCGTVNDLAAMGAKPLYLSCGFILEEGLPLEELERITASMAETAREAGVMLVTGDTKVVQRGAVDKIFINTSGIGNIPDGIELSGSNAHPGDCVIVTGTIGEHGSCILQEREELNLHGPIHSDCAPLNGLTGSLLAQIPGVHVMRDPTRGGIATTLNEIAIQSHVGIQLHEEEIPVLPEVEGLCELLGMDPLYMANEGKMLILLPQQQTEAAMALLQQHPLGRTARVIGKVIEENPGKVYMKTRTGGKRIVDMLSGEQLPRIC